MNKKGGFTLIELLAVIVILAIIALIATPIVLNIIDDAKNESDLRSAEFYLKGLELSISQATLDGDNIVDEMYNISKTGSICLEEYDPDSKVCIDGEDEGTDISELIVEVKGKTPTSGTIEIKNGQIEDISFELDNKVVEKDENGELIYVTKLTEVCKSIPETINVGDKYECDLGDGARFFYVLEVGKTRITNSTLKENEVALILNGNYDTETLPWCASGSDNSCNADGLTGKLDEIAGAWTKVSKNQIGIPSKEQIEGAYIGEMPTWLYSWDNSAWGDTVSGYWSSSLDGGNYNMAWIVRSIGRVDVDIVNYGGRNVVRPVINLKH